MRAFVAIVPPEPAVQHLRRAVAACRQDGDRLGWVAPERWHFTLAFLGEVDEERVERMSAELEQVAVVVPAFELGLAGAGAFPRADRARVLWAGVSGDVDVLDRLAAGTRRCARTAGIVLDAKPFRPHLTLARARRGVADVTDLVSQLTIVAAVPWLVDEIVVMRSRLGPHPRYEPVVRLPLRG